jgi:rhodanese-related sulfurtransferase
VVDGATPGTHEYDVPTATQQRAEGAMHMVIDIDRQTLLELMESGVQIVDVLPEREYESGHIPGAVNIPLKKLNAETVTVLQRDKPVVVY